MDDTFSYRDSGRCISLETGKIYCYQLRRIDVYESGVYTITLGLRVDFTYEIYNQNSSILFHPPYYGRYNREEFNLNFKFLDKHRTERINKILNEEV